MKSILAALLFCHVSLGINSFSPFEDLTAVTELKNERKRVEVGDSFFNDEDFGEEENGPDADSQSASGSGGGDEKEAETAIKSVVDALQDSVIPAVLKATKVKEGKDKEYTETIVEMMEDGDNKREVKRAFGKNVMEAYGNCVQLMQYSFLSAYKEGVFHHLKEAMGNDDINLEQLIYKIFMEVAKKNGGIMGEIFEAIEGDNGLHPAMKGVVVIKNLLLHAACGNPAEGLARAAIGRIFEDANDPDSPFAALSDRIIPFLREPGACRKGLISKDDKSISLKQKFLSLIFKAKNLCLDVPIVKQNVMAALKGQDVMKNISILHEAYYKRTHAMIEKVVKLIAHGQERYAFELVGKQSLRSLREALLIGLTVHKRMEMPEKRPTSPAAPGNRDYDAPFPATLLRDLERESDPRRTK